jgi:hypothetical protein
MSTSCNQVASESLPDRPPVWPMVVALVILAGLFLWPLAVGQMYTGSDIGVQHLPLRAGYSEALAAGEMPLWEPAIALGFPVLAEGQIGACHPLHIVLYRCLPLTAAMQLELLASYILAFFGGLVFLRYLRLQQLTVWFGAGAFSFSIFAISHYPHPNMVAVMAHLPWLLWLIFRLYDCASRRGRVAFATVFGMLLASQVLLGHPPAMFHAGLVWGSVALYQAWRRRAWSSLGILLMSLPLMLLLSAVQWLPTLQYLPFTERPHNEPGFQNQYSLHPLNLCQLLGPYLFVDGTVADHITGGSRIEFAVYPGLGILGLALLGILRTGELPSDQRRLVRLAMALLVVITFFMLGRYGYLNSLTEFIPIIGKFRSPSRYVALWQLCWIGLAIAGLDYLLLGGKKIVAGRVWALLIAAIVVVHALPLTGLALSRIARSGTELLVAAAITIGVVAGCWWLSRGARLRLSLLAALCLLDVGANGYHQVLQHLGRRQLADIHAEVNLRAAADRRFRISRISNYGVLAGEYNVLCYTGIQPRRTYNPGDNRTREILSVKRLWVGNQEFVAHNPLPRYRLMRQTGVLQVEPRDGSFEGIDVQDVVLLPPDEFVPLTSEPGTIDVLQDSRNHAKVKVSGAGVQLLVVGDRWDPDWHCTVDGRPTQIWRAYGIVRCVFVPGGTHIIDFVYEPSGYIFGRLLTMIGLVITTILLILTCRSGSSRN